ncbi:MAG: hypothetical protein VYE68_10975 [Acidobacteriota bacterium]|nr:hypothetical protein [Acidobacteriota bacterium]
MRNLIAGLIAFGLVLFALGLVSTLRYHRRSRERERHELLSTGRQIVAEVPTRDGLELFVTDTDHFYWGPIAIPKASIRLARVLINGSPLTSYHSRRHPFDDPGDSGSFADRPEGIAHDRWDVLIRTDSGDTLVECGSIRERVSQELARAVFDTVQADMEKRDEGKTS